MLGRRRSRRKYSHLCAFSFVAFDWLSVIAGQTSMRVKCILTVVIQKSNAVSVWNTVVMLSNSIRCHHMYHPREQLLVYGRPTT